MCDPILVTLLNMRPHYCQSSRENATSIQPLASYREVQPPGLLHVLLSCLSHKKGSTLLILCGNLLSIKNY